MAIKISAPRHLKTGQFEPKSMPAMPTNKKPMQRPGGKPAVCQVKSK